MYLSIPDMSCGHCRASITAAVTALDPNAQLDFEPEPRRARITTTASLDQVTEALDKAGFEASALPG